MSSPVTPQTSKTAKRARNRKKKAELKRLTVQTVMKQGSKSAVLKPGSSVQSVPGRIVSAQNVTRLMSQIPNVRLFQSVLRRMLLSETDPGEVPVLPRGISVGPAGYCEVVHSSGVNFDLKECITALRTANAPMLPAIGSIATSKVWGDTDFLFVQVHDGLVYGIMPVKPSTTRTWTAGIRCLPLNLSVMNGDVSWFSCEPVFTTALLTTTSMPSGFTYRPICTQCSPNANEQYFWIDASSSAQATVTVVVNFSTLTATSGSMVFETRLHRFVGPSEEDFTVETNTTTVFAPHVGGYVLTETFKVNWSGFHSFFFSVLNNALTVNDALIETSAGISVSETTTCATGFLIDAPHSFSANLADAYWLLGSGCMLSCRAPVLVTEGSIIGAQVDKTKGLFHSVTSDFASAYDSVEASRQFNSGAGARLQEGVWMYGSPVQYPSSIREMTMDDDRPLVKGLPISYLLPGAVKPGMKVVSISSSSSADSVAMRVTSRHVLEYETASQMVPSVIPMVLTPDAWGTITDLLYSAPVMTTNDWHTALLGVASRLGSVAQFFNKMGPAAMKLIGAAAGFSAGFSGLSAIASALA